MPIPIMGIPDNDSGREDKNNNSGVDYSFLTNFFTAQPEGKKIVTASNKDASLLFEIWSQGKKGCDGESIRVADCDVDQKEILRLKTMGLITGGTDSVQITNRGKRVITVMALGEVNNFEKKRQDKTYNEILAGLSKKNKPGYRIPKYAASSSNSLRLGAYGLEGAQESTLVDIFKEISKVTGAYMENRGSGKGSETVITDNYNGIEGDGTIEVSYVNNMIIVKNNYIKAGQKQVDMEEVPVNYDYPQTTVDSVNGIMSQYKGS